MFNREKLQRFSIRKLTVGTASVLIGVSLMTEMNNNKVYADVRTTNENSNSQVHDNSDGNTLNLSTDLKSKADEAGTADSEVTNNSNAKVGGDSVTDNSNARNVEIKNIDDSKKDQQSGDAVAPKEKTANTIQKHEENVAKGTTVDSNDLRVTKAQADLAATKINGKASSVVSPQIKQIQAKYQTSKNPTLEKQINPTDRNSDGKVVVKAEDPSDYPSEWNNLIDKDRYIYQVLSLNNDPDNDPDTKLILSVNRNDSTDTNIYAYVIANNKKIKTATVGVNQKEIIKINKRGYQINNDGSSNIIIDGNKESTQNSSTVTSAPGYYTSDGGYYDWWGVYHPNNIYHLYRNVNPIKQSYGLGSTTSIDGSAIGEIIPIYTESSVIKYYYCDDNGDLQEFKDSDLSLHPNVVVTGLTGQEFKIPNVDQYKQVIPGFYLTSKDIPTNFTGTLSQFEEGKYYKKAYYNYDTDNVKYYSVYHQVSPDGKMAVGVFDKNGYQITVYDENGYKRPELIEIGAGHYTKFEFQIQIQDQTQTQFLTVRNPYVTAAPHEVQFIYKKLGSIIPVDEHGKQIGNAIQFKNNLNDPTQALPGIVPSISGYHPKDRKVGDTVDPDSEDPSKDIEVEYVKSSTISVVYHDNTSDKDLSVKETTGDEGTSFNYNPATDLATLEGKGYVLDEKDNKVPDIPTKFTATDQIVTIHLKHGVQKVTSKTPSTDIPKKPDGSPAVDPKSLTKEVGLTVKYVNSDGADFTGKVPANHEQKVTFTGTAYVDKVTGELVVVDDSKTDKPQVIWTVKDSQEAKGSFTGVTSPSEEGYEITGVEVKVGDQPLNKDTDEYSAYTDGKDVKAVDGIDHNHGNIHIIVSYAKSSQNAKLTVIDENTGKHLGDYSDQGGYKDKIDFGQAPQDINNYISKGYVWDTDRTGAANYEGLKIGDYDSDQTTDQSWTVYLKHGVQKVTSKTPSTDIPKKPDGSPAVDPKSLTKEVGLTVKYVNSDGADFTGKVPANHEQKVTFTGTAYVDKVTGELVNAQKQADGTWVVDDSKTDPQVIWKADGKDSFDEVISPVENGYHLTGINRHRKGNNVEEITGLTQDSGSITVTVTYTKNGKIIPVDKDGNQITGADPDQDQPVFPTDPNDPSRVDSGKIPDLSDKGYHPLDKNVKPGDPVDPDSEDPSKDIEVEYVKSGTISVKYHDNTEDKDIDGYGKNDSGNEDDPFSYDPTNDLKTLTDQGYVLDGDMPEIPGQFTASAKEVIINLKHGTTTVTSNNPGHPGEPVDPKNSEGPKYPNGTELDQVKRTGTQTIHYVGAGDKTPADNKQTFVFTREITFDDVTGKIISVTPWNVQSHTFGNVDTPVIPGYHADKAVAGGETVTPDDLNKVITVTYAPDGNPGNPSDHGDTPSPEPTPEPETTPNPTPDDQHDSEISSDDNFEKVKAKDRLDKTNPKKVAAYKKERKIIKTKIAKQGHTEIAEPIEDKVTRENNVKVVSDPVENKAAEPKLPQTSEADNSIIGLLGMLLASFAAMFGFDSLHSHDKKHKN